MIVADIALDSATAVVASITQHKGTAEAIQLDVAVESAWQDAIHDVVSNHNRLDILVNNAGISSAGPIADCSFEQWRKVMAVNLDGAFLGSHYAIKAMSDGGSIINIASVSGINPPGGGAAAYCSSKAALRMFSKCLALECTDANNGVRVNIVSPGGVKTPMWEKEGFFQSMIEEHGSAEQAFCAMAAGVPSQEFIEPEEVAKTVLFLASNESSHLTGVEIVLDKGYHS